MPKLRRSLGFGSMPRDYSSLVALFPPRPIHDQTDYENTMEFVMALAGHELTSDQNDYLALLSELILLYDREHDQPPDKGSPAQRLRYLVEQAGLSASELGELLGNRRAGALLLSGRRGLSKANIRKLAAHFRLRADYFL